MYGARAILSFLLIAGGSIATGADCPTIIARSEWGAIAPTEYVPPLRILPAPFVVIHHAESGPCENKTACQAKVRSVQNYHVNTRKWEDIGYNFLVGEDGNVYEGRGWDKHGAHAIPYNFRSIGICFIGSFSDHLPSESAVNAAKSLIKCGVSLGKINGSYGLLGHRQAARTSCPGTKLYELIKTWPHWVANPSR